MTKTTEPQKSSTVTGKCFVAYARLSDDGRPIADSVRREQEDGMVKVAIVLPDPPTAAVWAWRAHVESMRDD